MMEKITVEYGGHGYTVRQGDRYSDRMNFDECMALLGCLLRQPQSEVIMNHYLGWMRTQEQWDKYFESFKHIANGGIDSLN